MNMGLPDYNYLHQLATQIRRDILRMVHGAQSGHPGGSLGCAELFVALYFYILRYKQPPLFDMNGINEDLFFLSNGHISPVWYATLARVGFFKIDELASFRMINSRLQGHPATHNHTPGVRIASGSLGQGISVAIGAAQSKKLNNDSHLVYVLTGDGELQEGQIWEAACYAAHHKVDNLIAFVDWNGQQIDGSLDHVLSLGNLASKWTAFGWDVLTTQGNDIHQLINTIEEAKQRTNQQKPIIILMKTTMGYGVDFMTKSNKWHGVAPNDEQLQQALSQLPETLGDY